MEAGNEGSSKRSAIAYLFVRPILGARGAAEASIISTLGHSLANILVELVPRSQG